MTRIVHLSDFHYGTEIAAVEAALKAELSLAACDLIVISGDITQRARHSQFRRAQTLLAGFSAPKLIVPGNHDMPLYDLPRRFTGSLSRYHRYINDAPYPCYSDEDVVVLGVNTGRPFLWKNGTVDERQIADIRERLASQPQERIRMLVTHHPLFARSARGLRMHGWAQRLLEGLGTSRPHVVLSGHLHVSHVLEVPGVDPECEGRILDIQAGTALSNRRRGEPNAYNCLDLDATGISVEVRSFDGHGFAYQKRLDYQRINDGWRLKIPQGSPE